MLNCSSFPFYAEMEKAMHKNPKVCKGWSLECLSLCKANSSREERERERGRGGGERQAKTNPHSL